MVLSYRHAFHAGNSADVFKHIVQSLLLRNTVANPRPFVYIDTHSGVGRYDLRSPYAQKKGEYVDGVQRVWQRRESCPQLVKPYLDIITSVNSTAAAGSASSVKPDSKDMKEEAFPFRFYPGSPRLAAEAMRQLDRAVLTELHSSDFPLLQQEFATDLRMSQYNTDGFKALKRFLPAPEGRAHVFIDPPYEVPEEYKRATEAAAEAIRLAPHTVVSMWAPVLRGRRALLDEMYAQLRRVPAGPGILAAELAAKPRPDDDARARDGAKIGMRGSAMIIVNPYDTLESELSTQLLPWLRDALFAKGEGEFSVRWLRQPDAEALKPKPPGPRASKRTRAPLYYGRKK